MYEYLYGGTDEARALEKISTIRTNNTTSYMRPILQQYAPIRLPGCSAKVTYTSNEPTVFTAPECFAIPFNRLLV